MGVKPVLEKQYYGHSSSSQSLNLFISFFVASENKLPKDSPFKTPYSNDVLTQSQFNSAPQFVDINTWVRSNISHPL